MTKEKALYTLIGDYSEGGYKGIDIKTKNCVTESLLGNKALRQELSSVESYSRCL